VFVRGKVNDRGAVLFYIVHNVRHGAKTVQRPILALGSHEKPGEALAAWRAELSTLERRRARPAGYEPTGMVERAELERVGRMIAKLERRIAKLTGLIKRGDIASE
jgi:hypothetical protein